jgi:uncharacterized protein (TIGR00730 family)
LSLTTKLHIKDNKARKFMQQSYSICVFCGASPHVEMKYFLLAKELGKLIAEKNHKLIYGGGSVGLMGAVSNSALDYNGEVIGIYPTFLQPTEKIQSIEPANNNLSQLILVKDLSERKKLMIEMSDAFVILPGGFGTLDEVFEVITWKYLNNLDYPIIFYNYEGYYNKLFAMIEDIYAARFAAERIKLTYSIIDNFEDLATLLNFNNTKVSDPLDI